MNRVTIDLSGCRYPLEVYDRIAVALDFPIFYGTNLDALWDCLTGFIDTCVYIEMKGVSTLPDGLRDYTMEMVDVFMRAANEESEMEFKLLD